MSPTSKDRITAGVVVLGFVSLLMDIASEMIHALLPSFLVVVLGAGAMEVGLIEGVAQITALVAKGVFGFLSDLGGKRKVFLLAGYGLSALSKPLFALASGVPTVLFARFADRLGKGIRGAPRDALIADLTDRSVRGRAYGLRQSMDNLGAVIGPVLAFALMALWQGNFRLVFWGALLPALGAVLLIIGWVRDPKPARGTIRVALSLRELWHLPWRYWLVLGVAVFVMLPRFSEAFFLLRGHELGMEDIHVPLLLAWMSLAYALVAYPAGRFFDRWGEKRLLLGSLGVLIAADVVLALARGADAVGLGAALWGMHMGLSQGVLTAMIARTLPAEKRGTGFGVFHLASGIALLLANLLAGMIWSFLGAAFMFVIAAVLALFALGFIIIAFGWMDHNKPGAADE